MKVAWVALVVAAATIAGCQRDEAAAPAPVAAAPTSAAAPASPTAPAGNGVPALGADQILQRAKTALGQARSYRVKGTMSENGQQTGMDLRFRGADSAATISFGTAKTELLAVGGKKYLRPNEQFWVMSTDAQQGKALHQILGGRWIAGADKDEAFAELFEIVSVDDLLKADGAVSKGAEKKIGGVPAIGLEDADDPGTILYIATTGKPYPLQMAGEGGSLTFSDFGTTFADIAKPAAGKIIDINTLKGN